MWPARVPEKEDEIGGNKHFLPRICENNIHDYVAKFSNHKEK